jgi:hypothetical protein
MLAAASLNERLVTSPDAPVAPGLYRGPSVSLAHESRFVICKSLTSADRKVLPIDELTVAAAEVAFRYFCHKTLSPRTQTNFCSAHWFA